VTRVPTKKQYERLKVIGGPDWLLLSPRCREWASHLKHGWVETFAPKRVSRSNTALRITPAGLRALADALERYGRETS
jgi:hypothetical protein